MGLVAPVVRHMKDLASSPGISGFAPIRQNRRQAVRKTYKDNLNPTPEQERELGRVLGFARSLAHTALEQRLSAWQRARVSVSRFQQEAEWKDIRADLPEDATIHLHVLHDALARLDKTYPAFFRRRMAREKAGFPRYQGRDRWPSFTSKECGNGATLDNSFLVLSKIGRIALRGSRPVEGTPRTATVSREADGWNAASPARMRPGGGGPRRDRRRA